MVAKSTAKSQACHAEIRGADRGIARLAQRIGDVCLDAVASLTPAKIKDTARQWLSKKPLDPDASSSARLITEAFALAGYLTLFSPSLLGVAPVERFARQRHANADDLTRAALDALAQTNFHLIRLRSRSAPQRVVVEDMTNGKSLSLFDRDLPDGVLSVCVAAWLAPLPNGEFVAVGPLTPLDPSALGEGLSFVRPGKGIVNSRRCAAAVYRHVMRHGGLRIEGLNAFPEDMFDEGVGVEEENDGDALDRLAIAMKAVGEGDAVPADIMEATRHIAAPFPLIQSLVRSVNARRQGRGDLADAFSRIGFIMMETLDRRAAIGSGGDGLSLELARGGD